MTFANFRAFDFSTPVATGPTPKAVACRLEDLAPCDRIWSRTRDLALTEAACTGKTIAEISTRLHLAQATVRSRWVWLKHAACHEEQPFGLAEQEALLLALRELAVRA